MLIPDPDSGQSEEARTSEKLAIPDQTLSGRDAPNTSHPFNTAAAENSGGNISQLSGKLLRSAARRLRRIKGLALSEAILRRIPSSTSAGTDGDAQTDFAMAALRTLLASDLPLEELVRLSFHPTLLDQELRRIRSDLGREAAADPALPSAPATAWAALRRKTSGSFSLDFNMAPDCQAAAALHGKRCATDR